MATKTRNPTSDVSFTGTWTAAPRWSAVDDHPDGGNPIADGITHGTTTAGEGLFGFTAFDVPPGSTNLSVQVIYYDFKNGTQACNIRARIRCNDTTGQDAPGGTHNPGNGNANIALRTDDYGTTNPKSGIAWTVNDINGVGTNGLTAFGVVSTDANPSITISSIIVQVTYSPPVPEEESDGCSVPLLSAAIQAGAGVLAAAALSASLAFGLQQQNEEIVPQPATVESASISGGAVLLFQDPSLVIGPWSIDDELPVQAAAFVFEEDPPWTPPIVDLSSPVITPWIDDGDLPPQPTATIEDEGSWRVPVFLEETRVDLAWVSHGQTDAVTPPAEGVPIDEAFWEPPRLALVSEPVWLISADESLPTHPEEEYWWRESWVAPRPLTPIWTVDDETPALAAPPSAPPDEVYLWREPQPWPPPLVTVWAVDEQIGPLAPAITVAEEYWWAAKPRPERTAPPFTDDEILPGARALIGDDYWWQSLWLRSPCAMPAITDDEALPSSPVAIQEEEWSWMWWQRVSPNVYLLLAQDDQILPGAQAVIGDVIIATTRFLGPRRSALSLQSRRSVEKL